MSATKGLSALTVVLAAWLWAGPIQAMPEGRFVSPDGGTTVFVGRTAEAGLRIELAIAAWDAPLRVSLMPRRHGRSFEEPAAPLGWFDRLMSRQPERLPFDGQRLVWATLADDALVVNALQVDRQGHPDLRRARLVPADDDGLRLELWRYGEMDAVAGPSLLLQRSTP
ncbi:MAG: hypothetical protein EA356_17365 [Geminicoccaceae bacterium]|nr:MAG: hypothetical protein EA356_17365 [Geminicoccaceae bacterium]